jgi:hypothetical protein
MCVCVYIYTHTHTKRLSAVFFEVRTEFWHLGELRLQKFSVSLYQPVSIYVYKQLVITIAITQVYPGLSGSPLKKAARAQVPAQIDKMQK